MEALRERFGKYHVLEKIAQGGMAEVYKVKTVGIAGFEKIQALKRILPSSAREARFIRSFVDEARIAVELTHRNIVQVFDFGKADGELFLAMELIEGRDLRTATAEAGARDLPVPIPVAAYIVCEVAAGLDYAHRKTDGYGGALGIVHCDVSPSNVMLSSDGYVKILDFGIARATFASALERRRLRGKPRYMAPEQTLGEPPTAAADVFALGIVAWELFTGLPLYRGPDLRSILEAVRKTDPPRIDRLNPKVPAEVVAAIATALSREPAHRGTAGDIVAACMRTAMQGGARALADWLAEIDAKPQKRAVVYNEPAPAAVAQPAPPAPASRESTQSLDASRSLANVPVPPGDLGEGTPGPDEVALDVAVDVAVEPPAPVQAPEQLTPGPPERDATLNILPKFGDQELTKTAPRQPQETPRRPQDTPPTGRYVDPIATGQRFGDRDPTGPAGAIQWHHEATTAGVGRLADALPPEGVAARAVTEPDPRPPRAAYDEIVLQPGVNPASLRFDDDVTVHAQPAPASFDELLVEVEEARGPGSELGALAEPIDDDLGEIRTGLVAVRRRSVVVAGVLEGAAPESLRPFARSLGELAYQRGGVVLAIDNVSLVVAFGLEVAGEDDVAVALAWALDGAAMVRDVGHEGERGVTLRVGGRTGVATTTGDAGARVPADALDDARALAREASPERPVFVGSVGRLTTKLYTLREVPAPRRIGRRSRMLEVVGTRGFEERDRANLERRGAFVGRTAQLAELEVWQQRAMAANRRLSVLISGAAGTGKSRLVAELIARRTEADPQLRVVLTATNPATRNAPFALIIDLYQTALGLPPGRGRHARTQLGQRLLHRLHQTATDVRARDRARVIVDDLERAMELRDGGGVATPEIADLRPRISAGLTAFRGERMTDRTRPLLTVIEDIHHADAPSLEVLRHALAVPASGPELLILTARPEGPPAPAVDAVIQVGDLVGGELRALIVDRLGDAATPLNIAAVIARGGGNPLFVEELAQAVREAGDDVPATARDVIVARADRLSPRTKVALRYAAVLGGVVRTRIVEELLAEEVPTRDTDERSPLDNELDELVAAGFLLRPGNSSEGELVFARGLIREVIYDSLSARAQRDSHARIGQLLASRFFAGREEPPAVIAEHLERGGATAGASAFWLRAGRLALAASDAEGAVAHFTRTLTLERELGATPPTATSRARRREALAGREEARRLLGDLAADPGDLDELQRLCEGEPRRLADVAIRRAQRMLRIGDFAGATVATVVAEDHAIAASDRRLHGESLRVRAEVLERLGRFDEALSVVGSARDLFAREGAAAEEMAAMVGAGRIHLMLAHYEMARAAYRPVLARIAKTSDPWLERVVHNHVAVIELCLGNFTAAMASAQRSLELCRRYGDRAREGDALSVSGIILLEVGQLEGAAAMFADALELLSRTGSRWSRADCLIYAGACEVRRGRGGGISMIDEALAEARRLGARYLEANALITRAGAALIRGELTQAVEDARAGAQVARDSQLIGYEIQGLARHAVALVRSRRSARLGEAGSLVHRALSLLDQQRFLEGSEEEVYAYCIEVLRAAGAEDRARRVQAAAREELLRRLATIEDPEWKASYAAQPECRAVLG